MLKVTIYPTDSFDICAEYTVGVIEVGSNRKVTLIENNYNDLLICFDSGDRRIFKGFRYILDEIDETKTRTEN